VLVKSSASIFGSPKSRLVHPARNKNTARARPQPTTPTRTALQFTALHSPAGVGYSSSGSGSGSGCAISDRSSADIGQRGARNPARQTEQKPPEPL
jgi:hypothetical protein